MEDIAAAIELLEMAARELESIGKGDAAEECMEIIAGLKAGATGEEEEAEIEEEEEAEAEE